jgi:hypothetical protein
MGRASRRITSVGAGLLLTAASFGVTASPAAAEVAVPQGDVGVLGCANHSHSNLDTATGRTRGNGVRIRSGPHTTCAVLGLASSNQVLDYRCFTVNEQGRTWTFLRNNATGVHGWVRDDQLNDGGSFVHC